MSKLLNQTEPFEMDYKIFTVQGGIVYEVDILHVTGFSTKTKTAVIVDIDHIYKNNEDIKPDIEMLGGKNRIVQAAKDHCIQMFLKLQVA